MSYLFAQLWMWLAVAFALGLVIGFAIAWLLRRKQVDVVEERIADDRRTGLLGEPTLRMPPEQPW